MYQTTQLAKGFAKKLDLNSHVAVTLYLCLLQICLLFFVRIWSELIPNRPTVIDIVA